MCKGSKHQGGFEDGGRQCVFAEVEDLKNVDENNRTEQRTNVRVIDTEVDMNVQLEQTPIKSDRSDYNNPLHATDDPKFNLIIKR